MSNKKNKKVYDVAVIGAGASGMMVAITAARRKKRVLILEHMDMAGKKILVTGNGRCNFTNRMQGTEFYHSGDPAFVLPALEQFTAEDAISFFQSIGIFPKDKNGYIYPASMQASSVREALLFELSRLGVTIKYGVGIRGITKQQDEFLISAKEGDYFAYSCILATGGCSQKKTGSDGSGFYYLNNFGHTYQEPLPSLTGMQAKQSYFKNIAGIRAEISANLLVDNEIADSDTGELQLTDYGLSGIVIFQLSGKATRALKNGQDVSVEIDFVPGNKTEMKKYLFQQMEQSVPILHILQGIFPKKLAEQFLILSAIPIESCTADISKSQIEGLWNRITKLKVDIAAMNKIEQAQVTSGGVTVSEVNPKTMESNYVKGLFFAGEMLDVDGKCGGYNLQWAWSSGYVAGLHSAEYVRG